MVKPLFSERRNPERSERSQQPCMKASPTSCSRLCLIGLWNISLRGLAGKRIIDQQMILRLERRARRALPTRAKTDLQRVGP